MMRMNKPNLNAFQSFYNQFMSNPMRMLKQAYNIPEGIDVNNPNTIIQHLLDTGQISQEQVNNAMGMRNNPLVKMLISGRR